MKRLLSIPVLAVCLISVMPVPAQAEALELNTDEQKILYAIGLISSRNVATFGLSEDEMKFVAAGLTDGAIGRDPRVEMETVGPMIRDYLANRTATMAAAESEASVAYLKQVASEEGARTTDSGLIFFDVKTGDGEKPVATDKVKIHYRGVLRDGTEFDSSYKRGDDPIIFDLTQSVPCFTEGLQMIQVGGKGRFVCPAALAYGDRGIPGVIPPGAALSFEVELFEISPPSTDDQPGESTP